MHYALDIPNSGDFYSPRLIADLAHEAEDSGWDGLFLWDHISVGPVRQPFSVTEPVYFGKTAIPIADPWVALSAAAMRTERIRLGTLVTPLARRRPWKLARETVSLDQLSNGRVVLGVGLGAPSDLEFGDFGEEADERIRGEMLDEALDLLSGLWKGKAFSHEGKYYHVKECIFLPPPVQSPRIPVWVGGVWPNKAPFRRAARWDGVCPIGKGGTELSPDAVKEIVAFIRWLRGDMTGYDVCASAKLPGCDRVEQMEECVAFAEAGATWWVQHIGPYYGTFEEGVARLRKGPPRA